MFILFFLFSFTFTDKVSAQTCTSWNPTASKLPSCSSPLFDPVCEGSGSTTGTDCCRNLNADYTCQNSADSLTGFYSFRCCSNPPATPTPTPFNCVSQSGLTFACFDKNSGCWANWVSASQNPDTSCAPNGTCCWYNPPATATPQPTSTPVPTVPGATETPAPTSTPVPPTSTPAATPTPLPAPQLVGSCSTDGKTLNYSWNQITDAVSYAIRIDDVSNGWDSNNPLPGDTINNNLPTTPTSYSRPSTPGASYDSWIHAVDNRGVYSNSSNHVGITCNNNCPVPDGLSPNQQNFCPTLQPDTWVQTLSWNAVPSADWYDIRVDDGNSTLPQENVWDLKPRTRSYRNI